jgi:hypothetical protein
MGVAANLGAQAFTQVMTTMEAEFPTIIYAYQFNATLDFTKNTCNSTYVALGLPEAAYAALCSNASASNQMFNFTDPLTTSFALVNIYQNNDTSFPEIVQNFLNITNLTSDDL